MMTPDQIREHINTDASDAALQDLIDAEVAAMDRIVGAVDEEIDYFYAAGDERLVLSRKADTITSVVEDDDLLVLDTDYAVEGGGIQLRRINADWGAEVVVTYTPLDQTAERKRVLIYLVKLGISQSGFQTERNPDFTLAPADYQVERRKALRQLVRSLRFA